MASRSKSTRAKPRAKSKKTSVMKKGTVVGELNGFPLLRIKAGSIQTAPYNPRKITEQAKQGLKKSVESFGLVQPIVVNKRTGNVVGGHQRLSTLDPESDTDVLVVDLDEDKEKALNATLNNRNIQGDWSEGIKDFLAEINLDIPELSTDLRLDELLSQVTAPKFETEVVPLEDLKPHPKNYRHHPEDQLDQIIGSIKQHGFYKNVTIANDGTILAGHGVTLAAKKMGMTRIPVRRLEIGPDDPKAIKLVAGDNELSRLANVDDRALADLLKEVMGEDPEALYGTGFDDKMLANLVMVSRPASEIANQDEASEWVGMPDYENPPEPIKVTVSMRNEDDVKEFFKRLGFDYGPKPKKSVWFPPKEREDPSNYRFEG